MLAIYQTFDGTGDFSAPADGSIGAFAARLSRYSKGCKQI